jgi:hypothetical protein
MKNKLSILVMAIGVSVSPTAPAQSYDFGDHSSQTLVSKSWAAQESSDDAAVIAYTSKCIEMFLPQALEQQKALSAPPTDKEEVFKQWALNDVGTALFIRGQAFERQGKNAEAIADYKVVAEQLPFAQCWDTQGWFWKPADGAGGRIKALEFDAM